MSLIIKLCLSKLSGPDSSVGIATDYGLGGPGIESRWGRDFPAVQTGPGAHPASCTMGIGSFPGVKCGRGVLLTTHPLLAPKSKKSRAITLLLSRQQPGLQRGYFTFNFLLLLYSLLLSSFPKQNCVCFSTSSTCE